MIICDRCRSEKAVLAVTIASLNRRGNPTNDGLCIDLHLCIECRMSFSLAIESFQNEPKSTESESVSRKPIA